MVSDVCFVTDQNQAVIVTLLDLSTAFDAVNYDILVGRLASRLGIRRLVLHWLNSYHRSHTQTVTIMLALSVLVDLLFGVPKGLVLGLLLFDMYLVPLDDIVGQHNSSMHSYADNP